MPSSPYIRTDITHALNTLIFQCLVQAVFLQNVVQGGPGVNIEVREGRGRCLVANKQIEVSDVPVNNVTFFFVSYH